MKKIFMIFMIVASLFISASAMAGGEPYGPEARRFGAGLYLGEPSGITLKGYLSKYLAIDGIFAWSFIDHGLTIIGDVTYDILDIPFTSKGTVTFPFYVGAGGKVAIHGKHEGRRRTIVNIHVPVGIGAQWQKYPVEIAFEASPGIAVYPDTEFDISGGFAVRYYFF